MIDKTSPGQFIGYLINGYNPDKATPIAMATTYDECFQTMVRRALANCCINDSLQVQRRDNLSADEFAQASALVESFFDGDILKPRAEQLAPYDPDECLVWGGI